MKQFYLYKTTGSFLFHITDPEKRPLKISGKSTFRSGSNPIAVVEASSLKEARKLAQPALDELRAQVEKEDFIPNEKGFARYSRNDGYPNQGKGEVVNFFVEETCLSCKGSGSVRYENSHTDETCNQCGGTGDCLKPYTFDGNGTAKSRRTAKESLAFLNESTTSMVLEDKNEDTVRVPKRRRSPAGN